MPKDVLGWRDPSSLQVVPVDSVGPLP